MVQKILSLNENRRLVVYVHNLPYELQSIRKHFDWDEVFMRETSLDYIANFMGDNFHTFFGYVVNEDSKRFMNNAVRQEIADQIRQLVNLKKKDIRKMCRFHEVMTIDESESFNGIRDLDTNEKITSTDMRINGKKFRGGKAA